MRILLTVVLVGGEMIPGIRERDWVGVVVTSPIKPYPGVLQRVATVKQGMNSLRTGHDVMLLMTQGRVTAAVFWRHTSLSFRVLYTRPCTLSASPFVAESMLVALWHGRTSGRWRACHVCGMADVLEGG